MITFLLLAGSAFAKADIVFKGVCGSYSYDLNIPSNKYYGGHCKDNVLVAYMDARTDYIRGIYSDPLVSDTIDTYSLSTGRVYHSLDWTQNDGKIEFIGVYGGLIYVLAGSFIGFTILFFTTFIFIEVAKK